MPITVGIGSAQNTLESLRRSLTLAFEAPVKHTTNWSDEGANARMVKLVRDRHDGPGKPPDSQSLAHAVTHYRSTGEPDGWRGLKRVCYGASLVDQNGWSLVGDEQLLEDLLSRAQSQDAPRKRTKCYQALLSAYFGFRLFQADPKTKAGWIRLREWLDAQLRNLAKDAERLPSWLAALIEHKNLLKDSPCDRYGSSLLAGDTKEFNFAMNSIGIASDSWVPEEAIVAQIKASITLDNNRFIEKLPAVLAITSSNTAMELSKSLRMKCVGLLIARYALIPSPTEHIFLRDAAVTQIGNPWLRKAVWDAEVVDTEGLPNNLAREMVCSWLKRGLITDVFYGDKRRREYWIRFEPFIEDMWFALGPSARMNYSEAFRDFRARAAGRILNLAGTNADNNAFVMQIGGYLAVEFSEQGNAFYLFKISELDSLLSRKLLSDKERVDIGIHVLKNKDQALFTLAHRDSRTSLVSWEQKFDEIVCPLIGKRPLQRPAFVPELEDILRTHKVDGQDLREKGGALWVLCNDSLATFNKKLTNLGFAYKDGKGWWRL